MFILELFTGHVYFCSLLFYNIHNTTVKQEVQRLESVIKKMKYETMTPNERPLVDVNSVECAHQHSEKYE